MNQKRIYEWFDSSTIGVAFCSNISADCVNEILSEKYKSPDHLFKSGYAKAIDDIFNFIKYEADVINMHTVEKKIDQLVKENLTLKKEVAK